MKDGMSLHMIEDLANEIRQDYFVYPYRKALISASAYDTAWVAMVPDPSRSSEPLVPGCLSWILTNQRKEGFWGEPDLLENGGPTIESLTATLACVVALTMWGVGKDHVSRGLSFIRRGTKILLNDYKDNSPPWFPLLFCGMLDLAERDGLNVITKRPGDVLEYYFNQRDQILKMNDIFGEPILSYLEVLPEKYVQQLKTDDILRQVDENGSLFRSPSATAAAFMVTGDTRCLAYINDLTNGNVHEHGVPGIYPMDEVLQKMCMVELLENVGCEEYFRDEIDEAMRRIYSDWKSYDNDEENQSVKKFHNPLRIYGDALAFRLLRMHGYDVSPARVCMFMQDEGTMGKIKEDSRPFMSAMINIYRASHILFPGESHLDEAGVFAKQILINYLSSGYDKNWRDIVVYIPDILKQINHEVQQSWISRTKILEQRNAIESNKGFHDLWMSKASYYRSTFLSDPRVHQLAKWNFEWRQQNFRNEVEELRRWAKGTGLYNIGFGREKTTYCYFLAASNKPSIKYSKVRKMTTKFSVLVTVADDFFDSEGTLKEIYELFEAVRRWEGSTLKGYGKIIFEAMDSLIKEEALECYNRHGQYVEDIFKDMYKGVFESWLKEAIWSREGHAPSLEEYLQVGVISIAIHAMTLPSCYFQSSLPRGHTDDLQYDDIALLTMHSGRLLNDTQSYQKEVKEGKLNSVHLYLKENPGSTIDDAIQLIKKDVEMKKREILQLILVDDPKRNQMPKEWKDTFLSSLKTFYLLFESDNLFDSATSLVEWIKNAFYNPIATPREEILGSHGLNDRLSKILEESSNEAKRELLLKKYQSGEREKKVSLRMGMRVKQQMQSKHRSFVASFSRMMIHKNMPSTFGIGFFR